MEIIPCHLHFFKEDRYPGYEKDFINIINEAKVSQVVVFGNDAQDETTNDTLVGLKDKFPEKIFCLPEINIKQSDVLERMTIFVKEQKMSGFKIYPSKCFCYPDDHKMFKIYERAVELDVPIAFHSGRVPGDFKKYGLLKYAQPIYLDEVAARFPELKIVISHAGNPMFEQTLMLGNRENINIDLTGVTGQWRDKFSMLFERYGENRMLHGGPNHYHKRYFLSCINDMLELLKEKQINNVAVQKIMGLNAKRIFNIK
jgi:uncharacterized protein